MRGFHNGTMHKLLGRIETNGCVDIIFPKYDDMSSCLIDLTMLWNQQMGEIGENGLCAMHNKVKYSHAHFTYGVTMAKDLFKLIHTDMFG